MNSVNQELDAALCHAGDLDSKNLSQYAQVPRPDIYRIIEDLMKLGLVNKIISRPITFRAIRFKKGISILLGRRKKETKKLEKNGNTIMKAFQKVAVQVESKNPGFIFLPN